MLATCTRTLQRWLWLTVIAVALHTCALALDVTTNTAPYCIYQLPIAAISRDNSGNITVTTTSNHYFQTGQNAVISGFQDMYGSHYGFNGTWSVTSVTNSTTFVCSTWTSNDPFSLTNTGTADMDTPTRTTLLQQAIDDVSAAGGGHVYIPAIERYYIDKPLFVDADNVSIVGTQGRAVLYTGNFSPIFLVGMPHDPKNAGGRGLTGGHYPAITMDASAGTRYGLRTKDSNGTTAFGYFPHCGLAYNASAWTQNGLNPYSYWLPPLCNQNNIDYYDYSLYKFTIELAVQNNAAGTLTGTLCGVGSPTIANDMTDRSMIYKLATDPANNNNLTFSFNTQNSNGTLSTQSVSFTTGITDTNLHRLTIQMDLTHQTGAGNQCTVWLDGTLKNKLSLPGGTLLNEYSYGAFRLGDVTNSSLAGNAAGADWTFCGFKVSSTLRYDQTLAINSTQASLPYQSDDSGGYQTVNDNNRFFWNGSDTVALLPLSSAPAGNAKTVVPLALGRQSGMMNGYWLIDRPSAPVSGLSFQHLAPVGGIGFLMGEASSASFFDFRGVCNCLSWGTMETPTYCAIDITNCNSLGSIDTAYAGSNQNLTMFCYSAYPGRNFMRLHGVNGSITGVMVNGPGPQCPYVFRAYAGPGGGPLTYTNIQCDNEGGASPINATFYHEASVNPVSGAAQTASNNTLTIDTLYYGTCAQSSAVLEIKDNPAASAGLLTITGICRPDGTMDGDRMDAWVRTDSPNTRWTGTVYDALQTSCNMRRWIAYTGAGGQCGIKVLHPNTTLPPAGGPSPTSYNGYAFTVGASNITVNSLGRWCYAGDSAAHTIGIYTTANPPVAVATATLSMNGATPGQFNYVSLGTGVTLTANTTYYLLCTEPNTSLDTWGDVVTTQGLYASLVTTGAASIIGASSTNALTNGLGNNGVAGDGYGPVSFTYNGGTAFVTSATLGRPLRNGTWLGGCDIFTVNHPVADGNGNKYIEYDCTQTGAPGTWSGVGKVN